MKKITLFLMLCLCSLATEARTLYWQKLEVDAHLDNHGALHVTERHHMVFSGAWNGGERSFRIIGGQNFTFHSIKRIDPDTGETQPLIKGNIHLVDHYRWYGNILRWRHRRPSDPPLQKALFIYELSYTYRNILLRQKNGLLLDHDFAFANRSWPIRKYSLKLRFDSEWQLTDPFPTLVSKDDLAPGHGVVYRIPLKHLGTTLPEVSSMMPPASRAELKNIIIGLVALILFVFLFFIWHESRRGVYRRLKPVDEIDQGWLEQHVFSMLPEVAGAAWDKNIAQAEVSALLARLDQEGKIKTHAYEITKFLFFKKPVMELTLLVDRNSFKGYEAELIRSLFISGKSTTNTLEIAKIYKYSGFNPAGEIDTGINKIVKKLVPDPKWRFGWRWIPGLIGLLCALTLLVYGVMKSNEDSIFFISIIALVLGLILVVSALIATIFYQKTILHPLWNMLRFSIPAWIYFTGLNLVFFSGIAEPNLGTALGLALIGLLLFNSSCNNARTRDSVERVALRKRLASARHYFQHELQKQGPQIQDSWYPYLIAFGLGKDMDYWYDAYGEGLNQHRNSGSSSSSFSSSAWSGGGGSFGGAGSSATWVAAVGTIAAGVSAPSSSSSSSGSSSSSSGGGSSGGGDGGGW